MPQAGHNFDVFGGVASPERICSPGFQGERLHRPKSVVVSRCLSTDHDARVEAPTASETGRYAFRHRPAAVIRLYNCEAGASKVKSTFRRDRWERKVSLSIGTVSRAEPDTESFKTTWRQPTPIPRDRSPFRQSCKNSLSSQCEITAAEEKQAAPKRTNEETYAFFHDSTPFPNNEILDGQT